MEEDMPESAEQMSSSGPDFPERLWWWLGIYAAGIVPVIHRCIFDFPISLPFILLTPFLFPFLLGLLLGGVLAHLLSCLLPFQEGLSFTIFTIAGVGFAYGGYLLHFYFTLKTPTRRKFDLLLLLLVAVVLLNEMVVLDTFGGISLHHRD